MRHRLALNTTGQHLALAGVVGLADDALRFHAFDHARCAIISDLQMALHEAGRCLALARDKLHGAIIERVVSCSIAS